MRDPIVRATPPTLAEGAVAHPTCDTLGNFRVRIAAGGGSSTTADGADVAEGSTTDAAATQGGPGTVSAKLRTVTAQLNTLAGYLDGVETLLTAGNASTASIDTKASSLSTAANQTTQITAEQAILAKLPTVGTAGTASANVVTVQGIAAGVPLPISGSFTIPAFDYQVFTYVGSTNNVSTQVFKTGGSGGTTVATLTFTYIAAGAADNDKIASITKS